LLLYVRDDKDGGGGVIEIAKHFFVWAVSPVLIFGIVVFALVRKQYFFGFISSTAIYFLCGYLAYFLFDRHLLIYNLNYSFYGVGPVVMGLILTYVWSTRIVAMIVKLLQRGTPE
jgi:hypothetical protein